MNKHITDTPRTHEGGARVKAFAKIELAERPSAQAKAAQKASRTRSGIRTEAFLRIERGERA